MTITATSARFRFVAPLAGIGLALSVYSVHQHMSIRLLGTAAAACNLSALFDCDAAALSPMSEWGSLPLGVWGAAYFAALLGLTARGGANGKHREAIAALSAAGVLACLALAFWSVIRLRTVCLVCTGVYASTAAIAWAVSPSLGVIVRPKQLKNVLWPAALAMAVAVLALGGVYHGLAPLATDSLAARALDEQSRKPAPTRTVAERRLRALLARPVAPPAMGRADASFQVLMFMDYTCPFCRTTSAELMDLIRDGADVRATFLHFPREQECDQGMVAEGHAGACALARIGECALRSADFSTVRAALYGTSGDPNLALTDVAVALKLSPEETGALKACAASAAVAALLASDIKLARTFGGEGSPLLVVNGAPRSFLWLKAQLRLAHGEASR